MYFTLGMCGVEGTNCKSATKVFRLLLFKKFFRN
uniref:Uncharacterized protein n=1 Tax=Anguilla anguilla TaxID=7936 RepID=A0A0E9UW17_ANGAN